MPESGGGISFRSLNGWGNILHAISRGMNTPSREMNIHSPVLPCIGVAFVFLSYSQHFVKLNVEMDLKFSVEICFLQND